MSSTNTTPATMKNAYYLMALDDVLGMPPGEISAKHNVSTGRFRIIRQAPAYQLLIEELRNRLMDRVIEQQSALAGKFDAEAPEAFNTLRSIHRDLGMPPSERRQSAVAILDRAPCAPRARKVEDPGVGRVLQIPEKTFQLFLTAAREAEEVIDVDFSDLPEAKEHVDKDDPDYFEA